MLAVITAITLGFLALWGTFYFSFFRQIDVEAIRRAVLNKILEQKPNADVLEIIETMSEIDFRLVIKKERNIPLLVAAIILVTSNLMLFMFSAARYLIYLPQEFRGNFPPLESLFLTIYLFTLIFAILLLVLEILYYVKLDQDRKEYG